jgi:4-alpha-glucanotransferase
MSWMENARKEDIEYAKEYLCLNDPKNYHWDMIRALIASPADLTIVQMQDLLGLGAESRMNQPSTVGKNWRWRAKSSDFSPEIAKKLYNYCRIYSRLPVKPETEEDDTDEITEEVAAEKNPEKE